MLSHLNGLTVGCPSLWCLRTLTEIVSFPKARFSESFFFSLFYFAEGIFRISKPKAYLIIHTFLRPRWHSEVFHAYFEDSRGLSVDTAFEWADSGLSVDTAFEWADSGLSVDNAFSSALGNGTKELKIGVRSLILNLDFALYFLRVSNEVHICLFTR